MCGEAGTLVHYQGMVNVVPSLRKTAFSYSKIEKIVNLGPSNSTFGYIHRSERRIKHTYTPVYTQRY